MFSRVSVTEMWLAKLVNNILLLLLLLLIIDAQNQG